MKKILSFVLAGAIATSLCACGGRSDDKLAGQYISVAGSLGSITMTGEDIAGFDITLDKGGKGSINVENEKGSISWTNDDKNVTINVDGTECVGVIGENTIEFKDFIGMGMDLKFAKKGTDAADPENYLTGNDKLMVGTWKSYKVTNALGDEIPDKFDPNGLVMTFTVDKKADISVLGTETKGLEWSLLGNFGSFDGDTDSGITWNIVDNELEASYSKDGEYCIFICKKDQ